MEFVKDKVILESFDVGGFFYGFRRKRWVFFECWLFFKLLLSFIEMFVGVEGIGIYLFLVF